MYFAFLDLEKAYDRVDRDAMWNVFRLPYMELVVDCCEERRVCMLAVKLVLG